MTTGAASSSSSSTTKTTTTRHYWRRTNTPRPWWPWGLLPLLGLALVFLFGALITAPAIQAEVRDTVGQRLDRAGIPVYAISADGRRVAARVGAAVPDDIFLTGLAASTTCDTWAGALTCPARVAIERDAADAAPAIASSRPHQFAVLREADSVILRGEVPSVAEHDRIVSLAGGYFGQVDNQLKISNEVAGADYAPAADRALAVANRLVSGHASWSGERLSVSGTAHLNDIAAVRAEFDTAPAGGMLGHFDVQALEQIGGDRQQCNAAFDDALSMATIRFQTSSATIDAGNEELLQRLANLASSCSGKLTIAGHTDNRGDADMNKALSLARAAAVRDALAALGIQSGRMNAVGYGETSPIASNESAEGRARNRRIAISVDQSE